MAAAATLAFITASSLFSSSSASVLDLPSPGEFPPECSTVQCFPKCCPMGQALINGACVVADHISFDPYIFNVTTTRLHYLMDMDEDSYHIVVGNPCRYTRLLFNPNETGVWDDGLLTFYNIPGENYSAHEYCLDANEKNYTYAVLCYNDLSASFEWLYTFGLVVSVFFLVLTMVIYLAIDTLRDLHGKSLVGHVACLAVSYTLIVAVQLSGESGYSDVCCRSLAFSIQFFLLSSFFWLHVMCVDALWGLLHAIGKSPIPYPRAKKWKWIANRNLWVIGTEAVDEDHEMQNKEMEKMVERRAFVCYAAYALLLSLLPVLLVMGKKLNPIIPSTYLDYNMKLHRCIFESDDASSLPYFYPLIGFIAFVNLIMFVVMVVIAWPGVYIAAWNKTGLQRVPKQKARMCFFLYALISVKWITDLFAWATDGGGIAWLMLDIFSILQGLVIFFIFVFEERVRDRVMYELWPRFYKINRKYTCCKKTISEENPMAPENTLMINTNTPEKNNV